MVSATDRDLWQGPKQEVRESRTSGFCAQPQKFETITVTIGYKNGQLLRLRRTLIAALGTRMEATRFYAAYTYLRWVTKGLARRRKLDPKLGLQ